MSTNIHDAACDTGQPCAMCHEPDAALFMDDPIVGTLAMREDERHVLITPESCPCDKRSDTPCNVCDGGLAVCAKCGKAEIELDGPCESEDDFWERESADTLAAVEEATCNDIDEVIRLRAAAPAIVAPRLRRILFDVLDEEAWHFVDDDSDTQLQRRVRFIDLVIARLRDDGA